jgi:hypothetical protein
MISFGRAVERETAPIISNASRIDLPSEPARGMYSLLDFRDLDDVCVEAVELLITITVALFFVMASSIRIMPGPNLRSAMERLDN